jgi:hypothetical protein
MQQDEPKTLSFAEIVRGRDASVPATDDGYLYAVKLAMVMTGADNNYAGQVNIQRKDFPIHEKNLE